MQIISHINMGYKNKLREIKVSNSKLNLLILQALYRGGLISSYNIDFINPTKCCVHLNLDFCNFVLKQISKPSYRQFVKARYLSRYKSPFFILSTTRGLLTPYDFLENNPTIGGECFFIVKNK